MELSVLAGKARVSQGLPLCFTHSAIHTKRIEARTHSHTHATCERRCLHLLTPSLNSNSPPICAVHLKGLLLNMTPGGCVSDASLLSVAISGYSHQKNSIRAYNASLYHQRVHGLVASSFTSFVYISPASSFLSKVSVMLKQNMSERRDKKKRERDRLL